MRRFAVLAVAWFAACSEETATPNTPPASTPAPTSIAAPKPTAVEGWETDGANYPLLGATLPGFKAARLGGGETTENDLRGRWTILGFWSGPDKAAKEETVYIAALDTAVDQDPNLDFLSVYLPQGASFDVTTWSEGANSWPTLQGDETLADALGIKTAPAYLLVGPDLTVEAYRGALSKTPEDGIKPVLRGVAEIKKQIAAPE